MSEVDLWREIRRLNDQVEYLKAFDVARPPVFLNTPLTSASWNGNSYSTTARTTIDTSAVFGVPAGVKALLVRAICRDSGSQATPGLEFKLYAGVSSNVAVDVRPSSKANDDPDERNGIVPCDANGDIGYGIVASGALTMDCWIIVLGYWKD